MVSCATKHCKRRYVDPCIKLSMDFPRRTIATAVRQKRCLTGHTLQKKKYVLEACELVLESLTDTLHQQQQRAELIVVHQWYTVKTQEFQGGDVEPIAPTIGYQRLEDPRR